ncbi:hypothetical protein FNV43_RR02124 [Rhamnella rubrinervis]|uniref:Uncharacterized protein n=1 Tax=Rhamnella rubrinervis TaxID=2594499 RepID=A0A8K0HRR9_9ROSA|nr:hypothetical protein FNV43_RR02124 [Rhamnella rubrinervis]
MSWTTALLNTLLKKNPGSIKSHSQADQTASWPRFSGPEVQFLLACPLDSLLLLLGSPSSDVTLPMAFSTTRWLLTLLMDLRLGETLHGCIIRFGMDSNLYTGNDALMNMYSKFQGSSESNGQSFSVPQVLDKKSEQKPVCGNAKREMSMRIQLLVIIAYEEVDDLSSWSDLHGSGASGFVPTSPTFRPPGLVRPHRELSEPYPLVRPRPAGPTSSFGRASHGWSDLSVLGFDPAYPGLVDLTPAVRPPKLGQASRLVGPPPGLVEHSRAVRPPGAWSGLPPAWSTSARVCSGLLHAWSGLPGTVQTSSGLVRPGLRLGRPPEFGPASRLGRALTRVCSDLSPAYSRPPAGLVRPHPAVDPRLDPTSSGYGSTSQEAVGLTRRSTSRVWSEPTALGRPPRSLFDPPGFGRASIRGGASRPDLLGLGGFGQALGTTWWASGLFRPPVWSDLRSVWSGLRGLSQASQNFSGLSWDLVRSLGHGQIAPGTGRTTQTWSDHPGGPFPLRVWPPAWSAYHRAWSGPRRDGQGSHLAWSDLMRLVRPGPRQSDLIGFGQTSHGLGRAYLAQLVDLTCGMDRPPGLVPILSWSGLHEGLVGPRRLGRPPAGLGSLAWFDPTRLGATSPGLVGLHSFPEPCGLGPGLRRLGRPLSRVWSGLLQA